MKYTAGIRRFLYEQLSDCSKTTSVNWRGESPAQPMFTPFISSILIQGWQEVQKKAWVWTLVKFRFIQLYLGILNLSLMS